MTEYKNGYRPKAMDEIKKKIRYTSDDRILFCYMIVNAENWWVLRIYYYW